MSQPMRFYGVIAVLLLLLAACRTGPVEIPQDLTQAEIFQRGQAGKASASAVSYLSIN